MSLDYFRESNTMRYFARLESSALGLNFGFRSKLTDERWSRDQVPSLRLERTPIFKPNAFDSSLEK